MLLLFLLSYTAFLWDNDAGLEIFDYNTEQWVGTEQYIKEALEDNGVETVVDITLLPIEDLMPFDMLFINCAWRTGEMINEVDRKTISALIDSGKSVNLEGNHVAGIMSEVSPDFLSKFGVKYDGTEYFIYPPVEGFPETFMQGEIFEYNPTDSLNFYVDRLDTLQGTNAEKIYGTQEGKALISMGIGGSDFVMKNGYFNYGTVFSSLCLCGLLSHPDDSIFTDSERRMEFTQKILGYFGYGSILVVDDNESDDDKLEWDLDSMGVIYDEYQNDSFPDPHYLRSYNVVLWTTGYTDSNTIPTEGQWVINDYLDWGGRIMLAGEGIGSDIGYPDQGEQNPFLPWGFGTDYIYDSIITNAVEGIDEFAGIVSSLYSPGADYLDTISGGKVILEYSPSYTPAGIKKEEARRKTEFLGFAYEGMVDRDRRLEFLERIMSGFNFNLARTSGVEERREENPQETIAYPNPFTHYTIIPTHSNSFVVYSITGRFIKKVEGDRWYGRDSEGRNLPSGIYLFRSKSGESGKVILVR